MNTVTIKDYLNQEQYEALSSRQGFHFMHPNKIMREQLLCQSLLIHF